MWTQLCERPAGRDSLGALRCATAGRVEGNWLCGLILPPVKTTLSSFPLFVQSQRKDLGGAGGQLLYLGKSGPVQQLAPLAQPPCPVLCGCPPGALLMEASLPEWEKTVASAGSQSYREGGQVEASQL